MSHKRVLNVSKPKGSRVNRRQRGGGRGGRGGKGGVNRLSRDRTRKRQSQPVDEATADGALKETRAAVARQDAVVLAGAAVPAHEARQPRDGVLTADGIRGARRDAHRAHRDTARRSGRCCRCRRRRCRRRCRRCRLAPRRHPAGRVDTVAGGQFA